VEIRVFGGHNPECHTRHDRRQLAPAMKVWIREMLVCGLSHEDIFKYITDEKTMPSSKLLRIS
jgi:hypothetical protein